MCVRVRVTEQPPVYLPLLGPRQDGRRQPASEHCPLLPPKQRTRGPDSQSALISDLPTCSRCRLEGGAARTRFVSPACRDATGRAQARAPGLPSRRGLRTPRHAVRMDGGQPESAPVRHGDGLFPLLGPCHSRYLRVPRVPTSRTPRVTSHLTHERVESTHSWHDTRTFPFAVSSEMRRSPCLCQPTAGSPHCSPRRQHHTRRLTHLLLLRPPSPRGSPARGQARPSGCSGRQAGSGRTLSAPGRGRPPLAVCLMGSACCRPSLPHPRGPGLRSSGHACPVPGVGAATMACAGGGVCADHHPPRSWRSFRGMCVRTLSLRPGSSSAPAPLRPPGAQARPLCALLRTLAPLAATHSHSTRLPGPRSRQLLWEWKPAVRFPCCGGWFGLSPAGVAAVRQGTSWAVWA